MFVGFLGKVTWVSLDRISMPTLDQLVHTSSRLAEESVVLWPQLASVLVSSTKVMRLDWSCSNWFSYIQECPMSVGHGQRVIIGAWPVHHC